MSGYFNVHHQGEGRTAPGIAQEEVHTVQEGGRTGREGDRIRAGLGNCIQKSRQYIDRSYSRHS